MIFPPQGNVISIKHVAANVKDEYCCYTDGNMEDLHIDEIKNN